MLSQYDQWILKVTREHLAKRCTDSQLEQRINETLEHQPDHPFNVAVREIYRAELYNRIHRQETPAEPVLNEFIFTGVTNMQVVAMSGGKSNNVKWQIIVYQLSEAAEVYRVVTTVGADTQEKQFEDWAKTVEYAKAFKRSMMTAQEAAK